MLLHQTTQAEHEEVRFNEMLIKYLQSSEFTDLVKTSVVKEFHCQLGFCVIAQVLLKDLLLTVWNNLPSKVIKTLGSTSQNVNYRGEVNSFVG